MTDPYLDAPAVSQLNALQVSQLARFVRTAFLFDKALFMQALLRMDRCMLAEILATGGRDFEPMLQDLLVHSHADVARHLLGVPHTPEWARHLARVHFATLAAEEASREITSAA